MNGNILFTTRGKIADKRSFGYADFSKQTPNADSMLFPLASISKTFTAVAVLQLRDAGKLNLDDRLVTYLPEFPYPEISIRHLLSHLSGLPDSETLFDSLIAKHPETILKNEDDLSALQLFAGSHSLLFKPGERWSYSSVGFQLLALLVEKISKVPFARYLSEKIFIPAGMMRTYVQTDLSQARQSNRTRNYQFNNHFEIKLMQMDTLPDWKEVDL
jgi:CubicO group peptidase (beta-lactamase class C family)